MTTRLFFLIGAVVCNTAVAFAQIPLTVEIAATKEWQLMPKQENNIQAIPNSSEFSVMSEDWATLQSIDPKNSKKTDLIKVTDVRAALVATLKIEPQLEFVPLKLEYIPLIAWSSEHEIIIQYENGYYTYNLKSKKSELLYLFPEDAENLDYTIAGKKTAYTLKNNLFIADGKNQKIAVTNESNTNIVSGQAIARSEFGITEGIFWSPEGDFVAFYQKDETNVTDYPLFNPNETPAVTKNIKYPMTGQGSEYAKVGIYNAKTGKTHYLETDGTQRDQYLTNVGWSSDEESVYVAIVNREQNHCWLNKYNTKTGKLEKTILEEKHDKYVEPEHPVYFLPKSSTDFLWCSEKDGFMHLYHYKSDGTFVKQLTKGNWVVLGIIGADEKSKTIFVKGTDETGLNVYTYAVNWESGKTEKLTNAEGVHECVLSGDKKFLYDGYSSLNIPHVGQFIEINNGKVHTHITSENPLKDYKIGKTEFMDIKADDGTILHGRLIKPSDFDPKKKYPVLIYVYGGPHAQMIENSWHGGAQLWMYAFAEKGHLVFTVDNRGSANRGVNFENVIHRQLGTVELSDQLKGVEYLKSLPFVDGQRIGVHGWSFGGFMTLTMLLRSPETFKVGVAGGAVTDWKYYEIMYGERYMDMPKENPDGYTQSSIFTHVKNLKAKLLVVHGAMDDVVVPQHPYNLMQNFITAGKDVDLFFYPNQKHGVGGKERLHLMNKMLNFLEAGLK